MSLEYSFSVHYLSLFIHIDFIGLEVLLVTVDFISLFLLKNYQKVVFSYISGVSGQPESKT